MMNHLKCSCTNKDCPVFSRCCFLPFNIQKLHPLDVAVIEDIQKALAFEVY